MNGPEPQQQIILHVSPQQALAPFLGAPAGPPGGGNSEDQNEPPAIDFTGIFGALRRRWWVVALSLLTCLSLGVAYILKAQRIYEAKGQVEVQQEAQTLLKEPTSARDLKSLEMLKTIESTINSDSFLLRVIKSARLKEDAGWMPPREAPYQEDEVVGYLQRQALAELVRGTRLISIKVTDPEPQRAQRIVQAFLNECASSSGDTEMAEAGAARMELQKLLEESEVALEDSDREIRQRRENFPHLQLDESPSDLKPNPAEVRANDLGKALLAQQEEVAKLANGVTQVREAGNAGLRQLMSIPAIAMDETVVSLQKVYSATQARYDEANARYLPKHPTLQKWSNELRSNESSLLAAARRRAATMENALSVAQANELKLGEELSDAREKAREYLKEQAKFSKLTAEHKIKKAHHNELLTRLKQAEVNQHFGGKVLSITSPPIRPTRPAKPDKKLVLAGAGVGGMTLGIGLVLLLYFLDRSVRNLDQGEKVFSLPGLAAVPDCPARHPMDRLLSSPYIQPESAEAFRSMRTSLSLLGKGVHARSILFTSPSAGDGKSYCATNYALTLAQQGYRTLLVDADLRKPSLDLLLLGRRNPAGLISHLRGDSGADQAKACTPTSIPNLFLFSAGEAGEGHPAELLSSQAFRDLLTDALKWFHRVVIDTPPVNAVTDALLLAREVDSVALVVRSGKTSRIDVRQAIRKLSAAGARPVGFILNAASKEALIKGYTGEYNHAMINPRAATPLALPFRPNA